MCGITASLTLQQPAVANGDVNEYVNGHADGHTNGHINGHIKPRHETLTKEIEESLEIVKHRGPDARGKWISSDGRVGKEKDILAQITH